MGDETGNAITNTGFASVASLIIGTASTTYDYIQVGNDSGGPGGGGTIPLASHTSLQSGFREFNQAGTVENAATDAIGDPNDQCEWDYTWAAGSFNGETITEAGIFSDSSAGGSSGTMLSRCTFTGVTLTASDSLQIVYEIQVKQGT